MTSIYLFALAAGLPLIVWSLLAGGDHGDASSGHVGDLSGGDLNVDLGAGFTLDPGATGPTSSDIVHVGDHGAYGTHDGFGAIMLRLFPLSSISMFLAVFGITGISMQLLGTSKPLTLLLALALGLGGGALNSAVFSYLRQTESTTAANDTSLMGATGHVILPIGVNRRGRVMVSLHGQSIYLSARLVETLGDNVRLEANTPILVVEVKQGIATVVPIEENLT